MNRDMFRQEHKQLSQLQANEIALVKAYAQKIIDRVSCIYEYLSDDSRIQLSKGTLELETAIMWIVKGLSGDIEQ